MAGENFEHPGAFERKTAGPIDPRYSLSNGDPYPDVAAACLAVIGAFRRGCTVLLPDGEYWWPAGGDLSNLSLTKKVAALESGSGNITASAVLATINTAASNVAITMVDGRLAFNATGGGVSIPGQVQGVTATPAAGKVTVAHTATAGATTYTRRYRKTGDTIWLAGPTNSALSVDITGLSPATSYEFQVAANNSAGTGPYSATAQASTPAVGPTITSFSPTAGPAGTVVTITGTNFTGATSVKFNNVVAVFNVVNATTITATAPAGVATGVLSVTTPAGTVNSAGSFTVQATTPASITLTPAAPSGVTGSVVSMRAAATAPSGRTLATLEIYKKTGSTLDLLATSTSSPLDFDFVTVQGPTSFQAVMVDNVGDVYNSTVQTVTGTAPGAKTYNILLTNSLGAAVASGSQGEDRNIAPTAARIDATNSVYVKAAHSGASVFALNSYMDDTVTAYSSSDNVHRMIAEANASGLYSSVNFFVLEYTNSINDDDNPLWVADYLIDVLCAKAMQYGASSATVIGGFFLSHHNNPDVGYDAFVPQFNRTVALCNYHTEQRLAIELAKPIAQRKFTGHLRPSTNGYTGLDGRDIILQLDGIHGNENFSDVVAHGVVDHSLKAGIGITDYTYKLPGIPEPPVNVNAITPTIPTAPSVFFDDTNDVLDYSTGGYADSEIEYNTFVDPVRRTYPGVFNPGNINRAAAWYNARIKANARTAFRYFSPESPSPEFHGIGGGNGIVAAWQSGGGASVAGDSITMNNASGFVTGELNLVYGTNYEIRITVDSWTAPGTRINFILNNDQNQLAVDQRYDIPEPPITEAGTRIIPFTPRVTAADVMNIQFVGGVSGHISSVNVFIV